MAGALLIVAVFWLAWSNGANDNFKGVATLYGSGAVGFRRALWLATAATIAGSLLSVILASTLAKAFSAKGLVPPELAQGSDLLISVAVAGAATILLATFLGMPTSTTHALTGALAGVALLVGHGEAHVTHLWNGFFRPLLISPLLAIVGAAALYMVLHKARRAFGINRRTCLCIGNGAPQPVCLTREGAALMAAPLGGGPSIMVGPSERCVERYDGHVVGVGAQTVVEGVHWVSGAAVCFARAVNDTPKIAVLLLAGGAPETGWKLGLVAVAMAVGGLLYSRKVAETMSNRITDLNPGQGLTANLITAALVLGASQLGLPVSTTHVSCGSIFGIGMVSRSARWKTIAQIIATWLTTLPLGALLGAGIYWGLTHL